ncbi:MAG TPA: hypothetical protein VJ983_03845, partial [candidate division Zixibacteria bacterium]|nr:hypothetical protein [candidate division Zixibacteria bacterium]
MRKILEYIVIVFGFVAPTFELVTRLCTHLFFNPLPTYIHIIAFYLLPASLLAAVLLISKPFTASRNRLATLCIAYALVVSVAYS